jgi:hypothetical protein
MTVWNDAKKEVLSVTSREKFSSIRWRWVLKATPRTSYSQEESQYSFEENKWDPGPVWIGSADRVFFPHQGFDSVTSRP